MKDQNPFMSCGCFNPIYGCNCCDQDCVPPEPSQGPVGPQGPQGDPGTPGTDGIDSFTVTTASATVPAIGNNVTLSVAHGLWAVPGQPIYVQGAGFFEVVSRTSTTIVAKNLGATGNASPGSSISLNSAVGPAGYASALLSPLSISDGGTGQSTKTAAFNALSPLTTTGDLIIYSSGTNARRAIGTTGQLLQVSGGLPTWVTPSFSASVITTGTLPLERGGTNGTDAATARASLGAAGLGADNTFTGDNQFDLGPSFFRVYSTGVQHIDINPSGSVFKMEDWSGNDSVDVQGRTLSGAWSQTQKKQTIASGSTFSAWTGVENVVSTYSSTGAQTITLPAGTAGRIVRITDAAGNASVNNITINRSGSDTIMGSTSFAINNDYGSIALQFVSSVSSWVPLP